MLGERPLAVDVVGGVVVVHVDELEHDEPAAQPQRGLHRVGEAALGRCPHGEPVDDHLDGVLLLLLQRRRLGQRDHLAVDPGPAVALGLQLAEQLDVLPLAAAHDRGEHLEAGALLQLEHPVHDLLRGLAGDRSPALGAVRVADPGEEKPQVVVHLGDRADGRARVARGGPLVDGDRRREALDEVDVGLVHLPEELAGVGRQRLHVAPLPLGEDRVEGEAGLPRPGQAREDDEGVAGQVERDVLEVVLPRSADDETVGHAVPKTLRWSAAHPVEAPPAMVRSTSDILAPRRRGRAAR